MISKKKFIATITEYYSTHGRHDLPWRTNITPYSVLVSEIMLQQTQVGRVTKKFLSWMERYPTLEELSSASLKDVLLLWQGLGYQRRAKALLRIAEMNRVVPATFNELKELPGVGEYTASAVSVFASNKFSHPVLETNIRTVLFHFFFKERKETVSDKELTTLLFGLEKEKEVLLLGARNWYYALMDYGAYLKEQGLSYNSKSSSYRKQSSFKGSTRELRAKILIAVAHGEKIPDDERSASILQHLVKEGFLEEQGNVLYMVK